MGRNDNPDNPYDAIDNWDGTGKTGQGGKNILGPPDRAGDKTPGKPDKGEGGRVRAGNREDVVTEDVPTEVVSVGGGAGGSFGSSGGYAPPTRFDRLASEAEGLYYQLWGEFPPPGYTQVLVKKGMNIFEIEDHERRKPAFTRTETYQNEYMAYAKMLSNLMGAR